jgi:hypothetical protein
MKHLRRYNEAVGGLKGVEEFCANYLANLLDDTSYGFNVRETMTGYSPSPSYIFLLFCNYSVSDIIEWNSVKDHVIPFLHMLIREYQIEPLPFYGGAGPNFHHCKNSGARYRYIDEDPWNRTIRFKQDDATYYYTSIKNVINDEDVPENFIQIQLQFY